jgi:hypothetical protein
MVARMILYMRLNLLGKDRPTLSGRPERKAAPFR